MYTQKIEMYQTALEIKRLSESIRWPETGNIMGENAERSETGVHNTAAGEDGISTRYRVHNDRDGEGEREFEREGQGEEVESGNGDRMAMRGLLAGDGAPNTRRRLMNMRMRRPMRGKGRGKGGKGKKGKSKKKKKKSKGKDKGKSKKGKSKMKYYSPVYSPVQTPHATPVYTPYPTRRKMSMKPVGPPNLDQTQRPSAAPVSPRPTNPGDTASPVTTVAPAVPSPGPPTPIITPSPTPPTGAGPSPKVTSSPSMAGDTAAPTTPQTALPTFTPGTFERCFPNDGPTVGCPNPDLAAICDKYNPTASFRDCYANCIIAFCCIHDSQSTRAPSCSQEQNCRFFDPCYIIWFQLHDTIGPAPYLRLNQNEAFFDINDDDFTQVIIDNPSFFDQLFGHHFQDDDLPLTDATFEDPNNW